MSALVEGRPSWAAGLGCYLPAMPMFVRVAHRRGWEVEVVKPGQPVEKAALASREEALAYAQTMEPDWIEVGDIVGLGTSAQHHSWTTLHRQADGSYAQSALRWGGRRLT